VLFAVQDLPPYKYKGSWSIEGDHPIEHINLSYFLQTLAFATSIALLLRLHGG
jgi:hypothetical protein